MTLGGPKWPNWGSPFHNATGSGRAGLISSRLIRPEPSQFLAMGEPWVLAFEAKVEIHPARNGGDLMKAGPAIEAAVSKYG